MTKGKRFVFVAAIVIAVLLIVGNRGGRVRANNMAIPASTPTGTPVTDPGTQGEAA